MRAKRKFKQCVFYTKRYSWKNIMEGLNTEEEKHKKTEMSFSSGWLKETTRQPDEKCYGIAPQYVPWTTTYDTDLEHAVVIKRSGINYNVKP